MREEKSEHVKILSIATKSENNHVYGLGDDGNVYIWISPKTWIIGY